MSAIDTQVWVVKYSEVVKITWCQPGLVKVYDVVSVRLVSVYEPPGTEGSKNCHVHSSEFEELKEPSNEVGVFKHTVGAEKEAVTAGLTIIVSIAGNEVQLLSSVTVSVTL